MADVSEQLERLANLLREGLITREEFDQQKQALLAAPSTPRGSSPNVGDSVGAYRILGELGRGGMGVVYRGKHRTAAIAKRQGGEVAIKILHAQYAQDEAFRDRFEREASMGLKLDHLGIVKVHDLVIDGGNLALVMDLAEGRPLSEVIGKETGPIPWERAWPMFNQMLDAVAYAHKHNVVHRDIKPENVIVSPSGQLKVLDFGIAKDMEGGKTKTGTGMGTVDYMAPEQYTDASKVDQRADVYALGMTLYEMLAGRLPWDPDATEFSILNLKAKGDLPPPTQFYPEIPGWVVWVVKSAIAVRLDDRIQSVEALFEALESDEGAVGPSVISDGDAEVRAPVVKTKSQLKSHGVSEHPEMVVQEQEAEAVYFDKVADPQKAYAWYVPPFVFMCLYMFSAWLWVVTYDPGPPAQFFIVPSVALLAWVHLKTKNKRLPAGPNRFLRALLILVVGLLGSIVSGNIFYEFGGQSTGETVGVVFMLCSMWWAGQVFLWPNLPNQPFHKAKR